MKRTYVIQGYYDDWAGWQDIDETKDYAVALVRYDQECAESNADLRIVQRTSSGCRVVQETVMTNYLPA